MEFEIGDQVEIIIGRETDLGFNVIINESFEGLLYKNEVFEPLERNSRRSAYIKKIREDGKFDISLQLQGFLHVIESQCDKILKRLKKSGDLYLTDKSSPEEILQEVHLSKKAFKKAIGVLYKKKKIKLEKDRIVLQ
ncbi:MAG: DNA-binding protein [Flavobacteriales bacterium]|jgi:predicted RNA-binding protein (virulence factor B family)|tara:strand:+ start:152 stop:562 length:411 start_codon:yes stop_codon:yes gene_type:complete